MLDANDLDGLDGPSLAAYLKVTGPSSRRTSPIPASSVRGGLMSAITGCWRSMAIRSSATWRSFRGSVGPPTSASYAWLSILPTAAATSAAPWRSGDFRTRWRMKLSKVVVEVVADQVATIALFQGLGFEAEAFLADHVRDATGRLHDLIVLSHQVDDTWGAMTTIGLDRILEG